MPSARSALIVAVAIAAAAIGWAASASYSRAAQVGSPPPADSVDSDWLAQAPAADDRLDREGPPPRVGFDRQGPPPGEEAFPGLRERLEQLRRIQEQMRELARESMPDQDTLRRLARQLDQALSRPGQELGEGLRDRWRDFMGRERGPADRRPVDRRPQEMRPLAGADAQARAAKGHVEFLELMQRIVSNPLQATIVAVRGIVDMSKGNPKQGIAALQSLLEQELPVVVRTAIRMGLRDLYEKAGDQQAAIEQLATVVKENAAAVKEHEQRRPAPPPPPPPAPR